MVYIFISFAEKHVEDDLQLAFSILCLTPQQLIPDSRYQIEKYLKKNEIEKKGNREKSAQRKKCIEKKADAYTLQYFSQQNRSDCR